MANTANHPTYQPRPYAPLSKLTDRQQQQQQPPQPTNNLFAHTTFPSNNLPLQQQQQNQQQTQQPQSQPQSTAVARLEREGPSNLSLLSEEQREEIAEAFALFDLDKDKRIDYHELKVAMKALGFEVRKQDILELLQSYGAPSSSTSQAQASGQQNTVGGYTHTKLLLSQQNFQYLMAARILARDPREEILRAFQLFDDGGKGRISLDDLRRVARELGEGLQEEELVAMIDEFDLDGDGMIDQDEFLSICLG